MLGRKSYDQDYIDHCRSLIADQLAAYDELLSAARNGKGGAKLDGAIESFEPRFFNNLVLVLDNLFVHRLRTLEGKDGNPLNEVRVICSSLLENGGVLAADKQIKLTPESSVLGYEEGDRIALDEAGFRRLSDAFFGEIQARFAG
jgi:hypothetical protein